MSDELVEEREGVIRRVHRRGRLDRVQGVDVDRPILARVFRAARLEIQMAGSDGNIRLIYLSSQLADGLRREILAAARNAHVPHPAAGAGAAVSGGPAAGAPSGSVLGDFVASRLDELLAPELDVALNTPASIVQLHPLRLIGSVLLDLAYPIVMLAVLLAALGGLTRWWVALIAVVPALIGLGSYAIRRIFRSLRYSISGTPDGIRVGFGLLSVSNDTIPADRIHAIQLEQPLLWRPFGWWMIRINRASHTHGRDSAGRGGHPIRPFGTIEEALRVVDLVLPGWQQPEAFASSPPRARWLRWFSRRWNAFAGD